MLGCLSHVCFFLVCLLLVPRPLFACSSYLVNLSLVCLSLVPRLLVPRPSTKLFEELVEHGTVNVAHLVFLFGVLADAV